MWQSQKNMVYQPFAQNECWDICCNHLLVIVNHRLSRPDKDSCTIERGWIDECVHDCKSRLVLCIYVSYSFYVFLTIYFRIFGCFDKISFFSRIMWPQPCLTFCCLWNSFWQEPQSNLKLGCSTQLTLYNSRIKLSHKM